MRRNLAHVWVARLSRVHYWLAALTLLWSGWACQLSSPASQDPTSLAAGRQAYHEQKYDDAIRQLTAAIAADPGSAEAYYLRGSSYYNRYTTAYQNHDPRADGEDFYRAITDFTKVIELDHQDAEAYNFRGLTYQGLGQVEQALADYDMAIRLKPELAPPYYGRGLLYETQGETQKAIADYTQFLKLSEDAYWRGEAEKRLAKLQASP